MSMTAPGNPQIEHDGVRSLHNLVLTEEGVALIKSVLSTYDIEAEFHGELESAEQRAERDLLRAKDQGDMPSLVCATCSWYDPRLKSQDSDGCGLLLPGILEGDMTPSGQADASSCPLKRGCKDALDDVD